MPEKISIMKESGELLNSNIVSIFMIPDTQKKYVITTENAVDPHGLTVLHVSELVKDDEDLVKIATDEEWSSIKTIMRAIISGNVGSYQYLPLIEKARVKGQYSRDISVSASAAKQMVDNYMTALKSLADAKKATPAVETENSSDTIFPTENVVTTETNEVSPGIADVTKTETDVVVQNVESAPVPLESTPSVIPTEVSPEVAPANSDVVVPTEVEAPSIIEEVAPQSSEPDVVTEPVAVAPVSDSSAVQPIVESNSSVVAEQPVNQDVSLSSEVATEPVAVQPVAENTQEVSSVSPVSENNEATPQPHQESVVSMDTPVVVVAEPAGIEDVAADVDSQTTIVENVDSQPVMATMAQDDIDALSNALAKKLDEIRQMAQRQQAPEVPAIDFNAKASFAPNATLDEVVAGSQQLFMEGVKNLVQTMTEKLYRELHQKEAELKEREELLNQREKMLNEQIAMMVNNYNKMHQGVGINTQTEQVNVGAVSSPNA